MDDDDLPNDDPDVVAGMKRLRELRASESAAIEFRKHSTDAARCPECGTTLQLAGTDEHPYWLCPECHVARLS